MSAMSCEPLRGHAYGEDLRWRMIYQREMLGFTYKDIAKNLNVDASTVCRRVKQFQEETSVAAKKNEGDHKMTDLEQFAILEAVLKNPGIYLCEIQRHVETIAGMMVSESAICRFLQQNNFSHKKLHFVASQRSEEIRAKFIGDCSLYGVEMLVVLDESGCDKRHTMRKFGYALKGNNS